MKAITITKFGGPEVLQVTEVPDLIPSKNEVLIQVKASGINRSDILQRQGKYAAPGSTSNEIPGLEVAGIIVECGPEVTQWNIGDHVCALLPGGGYAQYAAVKEGHCLPIPKGLNLTEAASLPETVFTVWSNIFERGNLKPGESLLVHGGSSGIGITAIQIAHALGSKVLTTVGSDQKAKYCMELGSNLSINYKTEDFEEILKSKGVDVILDMIAGPYFQKNLNILNEEGRLIHINAENGKNVELDIWQLMTKRISISGSTLRVRDDNYKNRLTKEVYKNVWPLIENGKFRPVIYQTFSYQNVIGAHQCMEEGSHIGKIILEWDSNI
ncbi:putative NAD(P)H quinone oxidoreductase, PIG3 family [Flavobacterium aquidurense]|uniref:Zinc-binding dehydrogenase n=1 Tax=Flavobacterium frigidimaris TaxID=262320 RepID=A0ABX4BTC6_FLAFR|nr:NAD(P)H-quinone oxidoreductase [Flavobacterium frigidimaris]OXA80326.1 zinc-binding dehydrogenase [Flavobacterium frigidimaris]SDY72729.1 putative NAD(P)H quinone oxidoreductase, PIG3 family [Flavobacterium aquidurense]